MYCSKCGASLNESWQVCPQCGTAIEKEEQAATPITTYQGSLGNPTPVLAWGITGLAFAVTFWLSFLGIIFSIVGLKKSKNYIEFTGNAPSKKAMIGRKLSIAGIIVGSIFTTFLIIFLIAAASNGGRYY